METKLQIESVWDLVSIRPAMKEINGNPDMAMESKLSDEELDGQNLTMNEWKARGIIERYYDGIIASKVEKYNRPYFIWKGIKD